jgi:hypothetical protein
VYVQIAEVRELCNGVLDLGGRHSGYLVKKQSCRNRPIPFFFQAQDAVNKLVKDLYDLRFEAEAFGGGRILVDGAYTKVFEKCVVGNDLSDLETKREKEGVGILHELGDIKTERLDDRGKFVVGEIWFGEKKLKKRVMQVHERHCPSRSWRESSLFDLVWARLKKSLDSAV